VRRRHKTAASGTRTGCCSDMHGAAEAERSELNRFVRERANAEDPVS
jgi:hypothetical protein